MSTNPCPAGTSPYIIQAGDTFFTIARRLGTTVSAITAANPGVNPSALVIGQRICIPSGPSETCPGGTIYVIRAGDTLYALATRFGVSLSALLAANPGINPNALTIGQRICIPTPSAPSARVTLPCALLLEPIFTALPPNAEIPVAGLVARAIAMNTRTFSVVASALPEPGTVGDFNSYAAVLTLTAEPGMTSPVTHILILARSTVPQQEVTWAGTDSYRELPATTDTVELRLYNNTTNRLGPIFMRGAFTGCHA